uniref:Putative secreted protein n=1 Tax=Anopheles darlingi TaxID=43151 RepID=A0A2M4DB61_ANODA
MRTSPENRLVESMLQVVLVNLLLQTNVATTSGIQRCLNTIGIHYTWRVIAALVYRSVRIAKKVVGSALLRSPKRLFCQQCQDTP